MSLYAVGRPGENFDGKIGIWPIVELKETKRNSKYYQRGEIRAYNLSLDKKTYLKYVLNSLLPAIK